MLEGHWGKEAMKKVQSTGDIDIHGAVRQSPKYISRTPKWIFRTHTYGDHENWEYLITPKVSEWIRNDE